MSSTTKQDQPRGGVVPLGKQKAIAAVDGKNRRALGDIGNLVNVRVNEGKPQTQITRPITRILSAQLHENAQTAAADDKKTAVVSVDIEVVSDVGRANKIINKSKAEISSSGVERVKKTFDENNIISCSKSRKKKVNTLTSVLTARSKVACGLTKKPKDLPDIDVDDTEDQLAVVDYVEDIYKFYKHAEHSSRPHYYMDSQAEINSRMRAILADWLIEVHYKFELTAETLYLTQYVIDRYLSMEQVFKKELQLVGVSAMLIASKYEEIWAPEVDDFINISDSAYTREEILGMEKKILNKLEWNLTVPTPYVFLVRYIKAALCDEQLEHMVFFFAELGLMQYSMIMYCPSMVAAAAVYAARCTLNKSPVWTETLKSHTGYSEQQLWDCSQILINSHAAARESKLKVVYRKYSSEKFGSVAKCSPATELLKKLKQTSIKD